MSRPTWFAREIPCRSYLRAAHVIDLRNTGHEELNRAGDQVFVVATPQGIVERAIDLIQVKVVCRCSRCHSALAIASRVNCLDKVVDFAGRKQAGLIFASGANINDTNAVVGIENGDAVLWANGEPMSEGLRIVREKSVQHERRKCEVVDPIDLTCDFQLLHCSDCEFRRGLRSLGHALAK